MRGGCITGAIQKEMVLSDRLETCSLLMPLPAKKKSERV